MLSMIILTTALPASPALAADYAFGSSNTLPAFGAPTSYDAPAVPEPVSDNTRRNKDAAYLPPPFSYGSGYIPTDASSPYHDNTPADAGYASNPTSKQGGSGTSQSSPAMLPDIPAAQGSAPAAQPSVSPYAGLLPSTSVYEAASYFTAPLYYEDGSIGTLHIPKLNKSLKVYEGETLENMRLGAGHFTSTSAWGGNVGIAGHNRGAAAYFSFVKELAAGDVITYTTKYGVREYRVFNTEKISETDYSALGWTAENTLTLITCVEGEPTYRRLVQAREVTK
jgi:sortase A